MDLFEDCIFAAKKPINPNWVSYHDRYNNGEKISIIVACMDRSHNLMIALENWISYEEISEIIVLDYGSKISLESLFIHNLSSKIKLYRVEAEYWHLSRAYNIAAQQVTGDIIIKMDTDYIIKPNFFKIYEIKYNGFIYGGDQIGPLWGFLSVYRNQFFKINGYNERLINYGYDDTDIFLRLQNISKLEPKKINQQTKDYLYHLPHSDEERLMNNRIKNLSLQELEKNNQKLSAAKPWSTKDRMTPKSVAIRII